MDKERIVHDLTMACLTVKSLPTMGGGVMVRETVEDYLEKSKIIRKFLEESQE